MTPHKAPLEIPHWTIPGDDALALSFGPLVGGEEAIIAAEAAMLAGWVIRLDGFRAKAQLRDRLKRDAKRAGRSLHLKTNELEPTSLWAWWS